MKLRQLARRQITLPAWMVPLLMFNSAGMILVFIRDFA